tara:strand:- start:202774 stop:203529 length:756 start_codon:yes stop_codon:yes gene_type:complete
MKILYLVSILFLFIACSSTPKGDYSRSHIDRPYALPDDVASVEFGASGYHTQVTEVDDISTSSLDVSSTDYAMPLLRFEQGINENVSWLYPLGVKWGVLRSREHNLGISFATLFLYTQYRIDYWYRLSEKVSLRPYFSSDQMDLLIFNTREDVIGLDILYQYTSNLALSLNLGSGKYEGYSPFFDQVLEDISGEEEDDIKVEGDIIKYGLGLIYSFHERWDLRTSLAQEIIDYSDFSTKRTELDLSLVYFY